MHCNALAANNVMQQQTGPFHRCRGWWECTDNAGEVWSTLRPVCGLCLAKHL